MTFVSFCCFFPPTSVESVISLLHRRLQSLPSELFRTCRDYPKNAFLPAEGCFHSYPLWLDVRSFLRTSGSSLSRAEVPLTAQVLVEGREHWERTACRTAANGSKGMTCRNIYCNVILL